MQEHLHEKQGIVAENSSLPKDALCNRAQIDNMDLQRLQISCKCLHQANWRLPQELIPVFVALRD